MVCHMVFPWVERHSSARLQDDGYVRAWSSEKGVSKQLWQMNCHRRSDALILKPCSCSKGVDDLGQKGIFYWKTMGSSHLVCSKWPCLFILSSPQKKVTYCCFGMLILYLFRVWSFGCMMASNVGLWKLELRVDMHYIQSYICFCCRVSASIRMKNNNSTTIPLEYNLCFWSFQLFHDIVSYIPIFDINFIILAS